MNATTTPQTPSTMLTNAGFVDEKRGITQPNPSSNWVLKMIYGRRYFLWLVSGILLYGVFLTHPVRAEMVYTPMLP